MKYIKNYTLIALMFFSLSIYAQVPCDATLGDPTIRINMDSTQYIVDPIGEVTQFDPNSYLPSDKKAIYWIHGMSGSDKSWEKAADWTDENYLSKSVRPDYGEDQVSWSQAISGLNNRINSDWNNETKSQITSHDRSFAICHSLGGVVTRKVSEDYNPEAINGIVTFNSPHGGSNVAYSIGPANGGPTNDGYEQFCDGIVDNAIEMGLAPILEAVYLGTIEPDTIYSILYNMGITPDFINTVNNVVNVLQNLNFIDAQEIISNYIKDKKYDLSDKLINFITTEAVGPLAPGSAVLNINEQIISEGIESKRVAFYGDITFGEQDAHYSAYKLLTSGYYTYIAPSSEQSTVLFNDQTQNQEAVAVYHDVKNHYHAKTAYYNYLWEKKPYLVKATWPISLNSFFSYAQANRLSQLYSSKHGGGAINDFNDFWEYATGAREYGYEQTPYGTCYIENIPLGTIVATENVLEGDCPNYDYYDAEGDAMDQYWVQYNGTFTNELHPYDGLLTTESQRDWNTDPNIQKVPLYNSNHLTVRNDVNTEQSLIDLYDGDLGKFFQTTKK